MKKLLLLLAAVGMLATAGEVGGDTDDGGITLPTGSIATIEQQSANITATLTTLQTTKSAASVKSMVLCTKTLKYSPLVGSLV